MFAVLYWSKRVACFTTGELEACLTWGKTGVSCVRYNVAVYIMFTRYNVAVYIMFTRYNVAVHIMFTRYNVAVYIMFTRHTFAVNVTFTQTKCEVHVIFTTNNSAVNFSFTWGKFAVYVTRVHWLTAVPWVNLQCVLPGYISRLLYQRYIFCACYPGTLVDCMLYQR